MISETTKDIESILYKRKLRDLTVAISDLEIGMKRFLTEETFSKVKNELYGELERLELMKPNS